MSRSRKGKSIFLALALSAVCFTALLAACAPGPNEQTGTKNEAGKIAGFPQGLWHGIIAPFSFVVSLFNEKVGVYEPRNNGGWYDFGYVIGLSIIFGGGGAGGAKSRRRRG